MALRSTKLNTGETAHRCHQFREGIACQFWEHMWAWSTAEYSSFSTAHPRLDPGTSKSKATSCLDPKDVLRLKAAGLAATVSVSLGVYLFILSVIYFFFVPVKAPVMLVSVMWRHTALAHAELRLLLFFFYHLLNLCRVRVFRTAFR